MATLGVVGAGTMGAGIAQVALEAGWEVRLHDAVAGAVERGQARIAEGLARRAGRRDVSAAGTMEWIDGCLARLTVVDDPTAVVAGATLVVEAIVEDLAAKRALMEVLDAAATPRTILATNTSALSVSAIAEAAGSHPERILGLHFFNPAPILVLVEVVAGGRTDAAVLDRAGAIVTSWGRTPVRSADTPGFIVNRVNRPFTIEALRLLEAGAAGVAEIDAAIRADGFPMGPFELMDLVGLDVNLAAATGVWEGLGRPERLRPSPVQAWLVAHGRLGRKSGVGFYRHGDRSDRIAEPLPAELVPSTRGGSAPSVDLARRIRSSIAAEAVLARDAGVATEADIDVALRLGAAHPQGPFAWARERAREQGEGAPDGGSG